MWKAQPFHRPCETLTFMTGPCVGHSVTKIPPDLLFGGEEEMDHPLKADVAATRRALSKQHDPPGPATAKTETDASRNTHTIAILHRGRTPTHTHPHTQPPLIYCYNRNTHKHTMGFYWHTKTYMAAMAERTSHGEELSIKSAQHERCLFLYER